MRMRIAQPYRTPPPVRRRGRAVTTHVEPKAKQVKLTAYEKHLARRFTYGLTPELANDIRKAGGGKKWFEKQLLPNRLSDPAGDTIDRWFPSLKRPAEEIFDRSNDETEYVWDVATDLSRWTMARRIHSKRQVQEVMTDFWSNLLNVSLFHDDAMFWRMDYDRVIRANALGTFERLLQSAIVHPAMGLYLDNAFSTKDAPNENLGRELLELHTVGVDGGYTEDDVKASARMLTGWRVDLWWPEFAAYYDPEVHDTEPVDVMDFHHNNANADGRGATLAYLSYLAKHPKTAARIARRLCVKFVSDTPSNAIVKAVTDAYLKSGTAIKPTLRALVGHPDFDAAPMGKVRMPAEDYVATVRALGIKLHAPGGPDDDEQGFVKDMYWHYSEGGQPPYEWPAPNGYPEVNGAWSGAGRVLTAFSQHRDLAARWWPTARASFPAEASMLPPMPATLQQVVDHLGQRMLGQKPGGTVSKGISVLLGVPLSKKLTAEEALDYWVFRGILSSLLDSPIHLHR